MKWSVVIAVSVFALAVFGALWYLFAPPKNGEGQIPGAIQGTTFYPSEFNPAQRVCAQSLDDRTLERCTDVSEQDGATAPTFSIIVPPGRYEVYATLNNPSDLGLSENTKAYYSAFVTCGLQYGCKDHTPLTVVVGNAQTVTGIRPHDWYSK